MWVFKVDCVISWWILCVCMVFMMFNVFCEWILFLCDMLVFSVMMIVLCFVMVLVIFKSFIVLLVIRFNLGLFRFSFWGDRVKVVIEWLVFSKFLIERCLMVFVVLNMIIFILFFFWDRCCLINWYGVKLIWCK